VVCSRGTLALPYLKGLSANQTSMDSITHPESDTCFWLSWV